MTKRRLKMANPPPVIAGTPGGIRGPEQSRTAGHRPGDAKSGYPGRIKVKRKSRKDGGDLASRVRFGFLCAIMVSAVAVPVSLLLTASAGHRPLDVLFGQRMHFFELLGLAILCFFLGALVAPPRKKRER